MDHRFHITLVTSVHPCERFSTWRRLALLVMGTVLCWTTMDIAASHPQDTLGKRVKAQAEPCQLGALIDLTRSEDASVRAQAARRLSTLKNNATQAVPAIIGLLDDHERVDDEVNGTVGDIAFEALVGVGDPAVQPCIQSVRNDYSVTRIDAIQRAMAKILGNGELQVVLASLGNRDAKTRAAAVLSLGQCDNPRIVEPLIGLFRDSDHDVRTLAVLHFQNHCDARVIGPLINLLDVADATLRCEAVRSLGEQNDGGLLPILTRIVNSQKEDLSVRCCAAESVGGMRTDAACNTLACIAGNSEMPDVLRCAAARGLGRLGTDPAVDVIESLLTNREQPLQLRVVAVYALLQTRSSRAAPMFEQLATRDDEARRVRFWSAVHCTELTGGNVSDVRIVEALQWYGLEKVHFVRGEAIDCAKRSLVSIRENGNTAEIRSSADLLIRKRFSD